MKQRLEDIEEHAAYDWGKLLVETLNSVPRTTATSCPKAMSSTPPRTPQKRKAPEAPSTPPTVSAKGQGAPAAAPMTPPTTLVSPAEPRPKKQNVSREAVPVSQDDEEERGAVAAAVGSPATICSKVAAARSDHASWYCIAAS